LYNRGQPSRASRTRQRSAMTALLTSREPFVKAGLPYLLLSCLLSLSAAIAGSRSGSARAQAPATVGRAHRAGRSKEGRSDIARFGERVQATLESMGNDKA